MGTRRNRKTHYKADLEKLQIKYAKLQAELKTANMISKAELRQDLKTATAELEKHRWIPVSEGVPKKVRFILCKSSTNLEVCDLQQNRDLQIARLKVYYTHWKPIILPKE